MNIFLDDIRFPKISHNEKRGLGAQFSNSENWTIARDYFEFVDLVDNYFDKIKLVSFDHDLACVKDGREWTGKDAVDYLIQKCLDTNSKFPDFYVHSDNTSGKANIIGSALNYLKHIENFDTSKFRYFHNGIINNEPV
jgi:hypothetical protein